MAVAPGTTAPDFKGTDSNGAQHTLSQYRGKFVVLEWANQGCPYDRKHYLSGSMESLPHTAPENVTRSDIRRIGGLIRALFLMCCGFLKLRTALRDHECVDRLLLYLAMNG